VRDEAAEDRLSVRTDRDLCMGSGNCHFLAEESFDLGDDGRVEVLSTVTDDEDRLLRAAEGCPVGAISLWRGDVRVGP
jgi:ferredoxin